MAAAPDREPDIGRSVPRPVIHSGGAGAVSLISADRRQWMAVD
jgi:hypothetical protein